MEAKLNKLRRYQLNAYMMDCQCIDGNDWPTKEDLVSDIIHFGYGQACLAYSI